MRQLIPKTIDPRAAHAALWSPTLRRQLRASRPPRTTAGKGWRAWVKEIFPELVEVDFADYQVEMWEWSERVARGEDVEPLAAVVPRSGGKTTTMSLICARLLALGALRFPVLASKDFEPAEDRVKSVRDLLESPRFRARYPAVGSPATNRRTGNVIAWNVRTLYTESRQAVKAVSLEKVKRGLMLWGMRPDALFFDDVDDTFDSVDRTRKKERRITAEVLPMFGRRRGPVMFTQNLIKSDGVAGRLISGKSDCLAGRKTIGPIPAIRDLQVERAELAVDVEGGTAIRVKHRIVGGTPTWAGLSLADCQEVIDLVGLTTFRHEYQHECWDFAGALLASTAFRYHQGAAFDLGILTRCGVGVDPSGGRAECGIVAGGRDSSGQIYILEDASLPMTPETDWARPAVIVAAKWGANIYAETTYGGAMVIKALEDAKRALVAEQHPGAGRVQIFGVTPTASKEDRAEPVRRAYLDGRIVHVHVFKAYETEWTTWVPGEGKSPNRLDAGVHMVNALEDRGCIRPAPVVEELGSHAFIA